MSGRPAPADARAEATLLRAIDPRGGEVAAAEVTAEVVALAREHRVSGLLARALDRGGLLGELPRELVARLRGDLLDDRMGRARLDAAGAAALEALRDAGLSPVLLKGAALGHLVYEDPYLRPMSDVDLLIPRDALARALEALEAAGFRLPPADHREFWEETWYDLPVEAPDGTPGAVELHWSIAQEGRHFPDVAGMLARARELRYGPVTGLALGPVDLHLHQALHLGYHYFQPKGIWVVDLALLHLAAEARPGELLERARSWGMRTVLLLAALHVERCFPGVAPGELLGPARRSLRLALVRRLFPPRRPLEVIGGWDSRARQRLLAPLLVDRPTTAVRAILAWARRTRRHGDLAGHRKLDEFH